MALSPCSVDTLLVVDQACAVFKICNLRTFFQHVSDGSVVEVVASELHLVIQEGEGSVETSHPGCSDAVAAAPAAHSAAHSATATAHTLHHTAGHIIETAVVGVVGIHNHTDLALVSKASDHSCSLETRIGHI